MGIQATTGKSRISRQTALLLVAVATMLASVARAGDSGCATDTASPPYLRITTDSGVIDVELYRDAAPRTTEALLDLASGTGHHAPYFDGVSFDYTRPRTEIRTGLTSSPTIVFETELDAAALGLDRDVVRDIPDAMAVVQRELLVAFGRDKHGHGLSQQLRDWLEVWYETYQPDFLLGVSRQTINEALGYVYTDNLASRPVTRGSVALVPGSPATATPSLSFALRDMPQRTGRWMVIGRVVNGLDLVEGISVADLAQPRHVKPRQYTPRSPVVIQSARPICSIHDSDPRSVQGGTKP